MSFKYELGARLKLIESEEVGEVIARAEYKTSQDCFLVRYKAGDGRQVENWWGEDAVVAE